MALRRKQYTPSRDKRRPVEHNGLSAYLRAFLDWSASKNYTKATCTARDTSIRRFIAWCDERGLHAPTEITRPILERYQRHLFYTRKANGEPLSVVTQLTLLHPLRAWFKWLARQNHVLYNPAAELDMPRKPRVLPRYVPTVDDIAHILSQPNLATPEGVRDRAILEVFYSTGIRRMELANLKLHDLDRHTGTLFIHQGKGQKDRFVPLGERAAAWLGKYLEQVRPRLVLPPDDGRVFLTDYGEPFINNRLSDLVKGYVLQAGIAHGACHLFRHAMATHMLENGADIRFIQAMLGHCELTSTQIYTHVAVRKLKEVHERTHPARLSRAEVALPAEAQAWLETLADEDGSEA